MSLLYLISAAAGALLPQPTEVPAGGCDRLIAPSADIRIERAEEIAPDSDFLPEAMRDRRAVSVDVPFCRIEGAIEGTIGFELWLPLSWNGRLLGAGVGGDAGRYNYVDMAARIAQGFATITTDAGHKATDQHWMRNAKARVDYTHRAVHLTAQAGKALAAQFYDQPVARSYYTGCSGGGRQALKEMQNYPGDYDGVIAGAPGPYMPLQSVRMMWFGLEQKREPEAALRDQDWALYEAQVTKACDGNDGVTDGIIENPAACRFDTASLLCKPGQTDACLTAPRLSMLNRIIAPMPDEAGEAMDGGLFPGVRTRPGPPSPLLRAMWADGVHDDPDWDEMSFRRTGDLVAANRAMPELRADSTRIGPFVAAGNKAILYQGWQDPSTNAGPTIEYYADLARAMGGADALAQSVRLFMVPGMYHCRGGPGADLFGGSGQLPLANGADPAKDMLWALINWVEQGVAPASMIASRNAPSEPGFTRRLCPFPQIAEYNGVGPVSDAHSYSCSADDTLEQFLN